MVTRPIRARLCLPLFLAFAISPYAQKPSKVAKDWWPDPSTGLMWTGEGGFGSTRGIEWEQANAYCSTLQLGGFSGWHLPNIDEAKGLLVPAVIPGVDIPSGAEYPRMGTIPASPRVYDPAYRSQLLKVPLATYGSGAWTATPAGAKKYWTIQPGGFTFYIKFLSNPPVSAKPTSNRMAALCVRPMEPEILAAAKQAQVLHPVPDLQTLKDYVPLGQAFDLYKQAKYQESITQAQAALALKPDMTSAVFDIGLCYAALKQWDQVLAAFQAALKLDKYNLDIKSAIAWAKQSRKAAAGHGKVNLQAPTWQ